ncbi:MAG: helix-turn-helix domain-containing protein, partial [Lactobacillales bacterium]|nr:helix-turn-helix domain-containing protein [Lactobacillales bacterium]
MKEYFIENEDMILLNTIEYIERKKDNRVTFEELIANIYTKRDKYNQLLFRFFDEIQYTELADCMSLKFEDKSIVFERLEGYSYNRIYSFFIKRSIMFQFINSIFLGTFKSLDIFLSEHNLTLRQFYYRKEKLDECLRKYKLRLNLRSGKKIIGEESQIRYFFFVLYWSLLQEDMTINPKFKSQKIMEYVLSKEEDRDYSVILKEKLILEIVAKRIQQGYYIADNETFEIEETPTISKKSMEEHFGKLYLEVFCLDKQYQKEMDSLYFFYCCMKTYSIEESNQTLWGVHFISHSSCKFTIEWVNEVQNFFPFTLSLSEVMFLVINVYYLHQAVVQFPGDFYTDSQQLLMNEVKIHYPQEEKNFQIFIQQLKKNSQVDFSSLLSDNFFINAQYFSFIQQILHRHQIKLKVFVLSQASVVQREQLKAWIKKYSPVKVEFVSDFEEEVDAVLADFYCNNWCRNEEVPFLCTSFCMDVLQIQRIS